MNTILLIDDDEDDLMLMKHAIMEIDNSYELYEVENGQAALNYLNNSFLSNHLPCLIILDINMPVLNGMQFLQIIKNEDKFSRIPIVVLTTSANKEDENFCKKYNVDMVTKPFKMKPLFETVKKMLMRCQGT